VRFFSLVIFITFTLFATSDDYQKEFHFPKDLSFLNLNEEQKTSLKKILQQHRKALKELHEKEEEWEEELKKEFIRVNFSKENFKKKSWELKKSIIELEANFFEQIHAILNAQQRAKFIEYIEEWEVE